MASLTASSEEVNADILRVVVVAPSTSLIYDDGLRAFVHPSVLRTHHLQASSPLVLNLSGNSKEGQQERRIVVDVWPRSTLGELEIYIPSALLPEASVAWQARIEASKASGHGKKDKAGSASSHTAVQLADQVVLGYVADKGADEGSTKLLQTRTKDQLVKQKYILQDGSFTLDVQGTPAVMHIAKITSAREQDSGDLADKVFKVSRSTDVVLQPVATTSKPDGKDTPPGTQTAAQSVNGALKKEQAYATLGGLDSQIEELRKLVELPLRRPDIFRRYGLQPPRGLLLFGPPGTGKTTLAYSAAKACLPASSIETISGPELTSSLHGGTERALRKVFERARKNAPSVVVIDEIDALAPRRDGDSDGSGEVEKRVVATLLTLMDGLGAAQEEEQQQQGAGRVVVIAATNRPNAIDPALRRPGRLDREIEVGIPTRDARLAILDVLLKNVPHSLARDHIAQIADRTHGYVGADLSALVREAGMHALTRSIHTLTSEADDLSIQFDVLTMDEPAGVSYDDFAFAQTKVRPSAMREISLELPKVTWNDIAPGKAGLEVQRAVRECVEWPLKHRDTMTRLGVQAPRGVLLYGPPGCSKTLIARALASESGLNFVAVKGGELINKYVGESERALRDVFRKARAASPSIVFFDEIDGLTTSRSSGGDGVGDRLITTLLNEMDGIEQLTNVLVVAATNRPDVLDVALLRPGRLDKLLYVGPPDVDARRQILSIRARKMATAEDVDLDAIADLTQGCSGAEVVSVCQDAGLRAMNEDLNAPAIRQAHFEAAARNVRRRITPFMLQKYEAWRDQVAM